MALPEGFKIDIGTAPNTKTGDPLRTAYQKSNAADEYLLGLIENVKQTQIVSSLPPEPEAETLYANTSDGTLQVWDGVNWIPFGGGESGNGLSAYELAVQEGFEGTLQEWLLSLEGADGEDGTSVTILGSYPTEEDLNAAHPTGTEGDAYLVQGFLYVWNGSAWENVGEIKGPKGDKGEPGVSAYQVWLNNGNTGTESDFINSLKGEKGAEGISAYQVWLNAGNSGTEQDFLDSLKGEDGNAGDSAYQIAVNNGFVGTEAEWLESLKGDPGDGTERTTVKTYGATGDGTTEDSQAFQDAIDDVPDGGDVIVPKGRYLISNRVSKTNKNFNLIIEEGAVIIKNLSGKVFDFRGGYSNIKTVSSLVIDNVYNAEIYVSTPSDYSSGDLIRIVSEDIIGGWVSGIPAHRNAEFLTVHEVFADHITVIGKPIYPYSTDIRIGKLNKTTVNIIGGEFETNNTDADGYIDLYNLYLPKLIDITFESSIRYAITATGCYRYLVDNMNVESGFKDNDVRGGGFSDIACTDGRLINSTAKWCRHGIFTTGAHWVTRTNDLGIYGETMWATIKDCSAFGNLHAPFDTHEQGYGITFDNCRAYQTITGGFSIRGESVTLNDCHVDGGDSAAYQIFNYSGTTTTDNVKMKGCTSKSVFRGVSVEGNGTVINVDMENCNIESESNPLQVNQGIVTLKGGKLTTESGRILVENGSQVIGDGTTMVIKSGSNPSIVSIKEGSKFHGYNFIVENKSGNLLKLNSTGSDDTGNELILTETKIYGLVDTSSSVVINKPYFAVLKYSCIAVDDDIKITNIIKTRLIEIPESELSSIDPQGVAEWLNNANIIKSGDIIVKTIPIDAPPPVPEKLTGDIFSTTAWGGYEAEKAFDGIAGGDNAFASRYPHNETYIGLDLGDSKRITQVRIHPRSSNYVALHNVAIQGSNTSTSSDFTTLANTGTTVDSSTWFEFDITIETEYRYIRLFREGNAEDQAMDVSELEIYGY